MRGAETPRPTRERRFPWLPLVLLLVSLYLFWVLPHQLGDRPVKVEFEAAGEKK
ncbi:MAG TPA: hypothetical protein PLL78_05615 [Fimbriimonadaceae bacterium]|nr:hypothetical protein [Fimbriimonadaceae bacterium]HRJ96145.1 hypothetical protein [Fimbriimonadaceae bacterium]